MSLTTLPILITESALGQTPGYDPVTNGGPAPDPPVIYGSGPAPELSVQTTQQRGDLIGDINQGTDQFLDRTQQQYYPPTYSQTPDGFPTQQYPIDPNNLPLDPSSPPEQVKSILREGYSKDSSQMDFILEQNNLKRDNLPEDIKKIFKDYDSDREQIRKGIKAGLSPHDTKINLKLLYGDQSTAARDNIYYELKRERGFLPHIGITAAGTVVSIFCPPAGLAILGYECYRSIGEEARHKQAWDAFTSFFD